MASTQHTKNYPPLVAIGVILFLALAVLPSALTLPQSNPSTTLEYAPVPPSDQNNPPSSRGNLSSLGLASTGTLGVADVGAGALPPVSTAAGVGKNPSTKRCIGKPPRQTEDPLSPPCVAYFQGDNFGSTWQGVSRDEIRVVYYIDNTCNFDTKAQCETPNAMYDMAKPPEPNEPVFARSVRLWQRYFNERYQTYNRFVHFYAYYAADAVTPEARRADAVDVYSKVKPFAVLTFALFGNENAFLEVMAQKGVLNFGSVLGREAAFFAKYPRLIWGFNPSIEIQAKQFTTWICNKIVGRPVAFGQAADNGKPRVLGMLKVGNKDFPGMQKFAAVVRQQVEACGGTIAAEASYAAVGSATWSQHYYWPDSDARATQNMTALQAAHVTTIIRPQGYDTAHSRNGAALGYYPEWIVAGDSLVDGWGGNQYQDQTSWDHAWVVSNATLDPPPAKSRCYDTQFEADPNAVSRDASYTCLVGSWYQDLRQLFTAIQLAGPKLNPDSIDKGFHAIPPVASTNPSVPACFYNPGDYTCVKDAVQMYWDSSRTNPDGTPGCWRMPEGAKRYLTGAWSAGDPTPQRGPGDVCNGFRGTYAL